MCGQQSLLRPFCPRLPRAFSVNSIKICIICVCLRPVIYLNATQPLLLAPVLGASHEENSRSERVALSAALGDEGREPQKQPACNRLSSNLGSILLDYKGVEQCE